MVERSLTILVDGASVRCGRRIFLRAERVRSSCRGRRALSIALQPVAARSVFIGIQEEDALQPCNDSQMFVRTNELFYRECFSNFNHGSQLQRIERTQAPDPGVII